jgi:hypothetical protein
MAMIWMARCGRERPRSCSLGACVSHRDARIQQTYFFSLFLLDKSSDFFELSDFWELSDLEELSGFEESSDFDLLSFFEEESPLEEFDEEEGAEDFLA